MDVGGNWLRFYRHGSFEDDPAQRRSGLLRVIHVSARQGDSRDDDDQAIAVLDAGLTRYADAPRIEEFEALLYRAELIAPTGADAAPDLAAASALLAEHQRGAEAERALTLAVEAEHTTEQQNEIATTRPAAEPEKVIVPDVTGLAVCVAIATLQAAGSMCPS